MAKYIPNDIKQEYPQIPWKEMTGMRDKLIHAYSEVDFKLVWMTIKQRIPELRSYISKIFEDISE